MTTRIDAMKELEKLLQDIRERIHGLEPAKPKPLYQLAHEALEEIGHPAKAKEVTRVMRRKDPRRKVNPVLTYQALEYGKRHKGDVKRARGGFWTTVEH